MKRIPRHVGLTPAELAILRPLSSPVKIQNYLDTIPINFEPEGDTAHSPRRVMREGRAHCFEGALLAALALWYQGRPPLIVDLASSRRDIDHVITVFKQYGHWGSISKTNHAVLRYREPVYETLHELVMSYFHEYFLDDGTKTFRSYSEPFDLSLLEDTSWITSEQNLWPLITKLNRHTHYEIVTRRMIAGLRKADVIERTAGKLSEWKKE